MQGVGTLVDEKLFVVKLYLKFSSEHVMYKIGSLGITAFKEKQVFEIGDMSGIQFFVLSILILMSPVSCSYPIEYQYQEKPPRGPIIADLIFNKQRTNSSVILVDTLTFVKYEIPEPLRNERKPCENFCPNGCPHCRCDGFMVECMETNNTTVPTIVEHVKVVRMDFNLITELNSTTFDGIRHAENLSIQFNRINVITAGTFCGMDSLVSLNLMGNFIFEIKNYTFSSLPSLQYLNLRQNNIASVDANAFFNLNNLELLVLNVKKLQRLPIFQHENISTLSSGN